MADDNDSKTEQPTGRRLSRAHDEGEVLQSQEVKTAAMIIASLALVWVIAVPMMGKLERILYALLAQADSLRIGSVDAYTTFITNTFMSVAVIMAIPFAMFVAVALAASVMQTGFIFTTEKLGFNPERLNPLSGLGRMFSQQSLIDLVKNIIKLAVVGGVALIFVYPKFKGIQSVPMMETQGILAFLHSLVIRLMMAIAVMITIIAAGDWFYQRYAYMKKLRMTKQEVKDEQKQTEGDPMVKARLRSLRMQRARQRMMASVPKADVVITNPTHFACALKYEQGSMTAPILVAKGQDFVAQRIRQIANENNVPIVENAPLARALYATVDIDKEIPPQHYKAVAEVISYVFRLKGKLRK
ncbi:MAG TPA: flagellar biosynthesis protein FlhB [Magnetospirillaceae bacterium]|jgi:flagellar biosynthetic protein FlhB